MPRTFTEEKTVFKFEELDESAQSKALDCFREGACAAKFARGGADLFRSSPTLPND